MDLHLHSPIRLQVMVFSEAKQHINRNFPPYVYKVHSFRTEKKSSLLLTFKNRASYI